MLVIAAIAIVIGVAVLWLASAALTARHNSRVAPTSSGGIVELGSASRLAAQFQRGGDVPMYFPDVSGNSRRAVYVTHDGGSSTTGWSAFLAQVPSEDPSCQWQWNPSKDRFDASCDTTRHASRDGAGLQHYPVSVVKGRLHLDFRSSTGTSTTR